MNVSDKLTKAHFEISIIIFKISLRTDEVFLGWKGKNSSVNVEKRYWGILGISVFSKVPEDNLRTMSIYRKQNVIKVSGKKM